MSHFLNSAFDVPDKSVPVYEWLIHFCDISAEEKHIICSLAFVCVMKGK